MSGFKIACFPVVMIALGFLGLPVWCNQEGGADDDPLVKPAQILIFADMACKVSVDGKHHKTLAAGGAVNVALEDLGKHRVVARTLDGKDQWVKMVNFRAPGRILVNVALAPVKAAREKAEQEAADAALRAQNLEAAAKRKLAAAERRRLEAEMAAERARLEAERLIREAEKKGLDMVLIPAGKFTMGTQKVQLDENPAHKVVISKPFYIGRYEVTQALWETVMESNPSKFQGIHLPVEQVSWNQVQEFLRRLNEREEGAPYRLPTEAEWEYACRAGTKSDAAEDLDTAAWYRANSGYKTHPVDSKSANPWGLVGMYGNVHEWCADDLRAYRDKKELNPMGPLDTNTRAFRGGSWFADFESCRPAKRHQGKRDYRSRFLGFRLARDLEDPTEESL